MPLLPVRLHGSRHVALVAWLPLALAACASFGHPAVGAPPSNSTLYARLGGYEAIAAVADDFLSRVMSDARVAPFFKGLEAKDMQRTRQHLVDLLCTATGGPCYYPGRDMKSVHAQFEITGDVWNAFTGHFNETFARFKVEERERNELVAIVQSLRGDIVNRP
jgi:hemoglobin